MKRNYQVIEDNGGGLHLAVFENGNVVYLHSGYEYVQGQLLCDIIALQGEDDVSEWDGNTDNPQQEYDDLMDGYGVEVIADTNGIYYDLMGAAGGREFGQHD